MKQDVTIELAGGKQIKFETGRMAKQASGAALTSSGDNVILATAVASPDPKEGIDFFPLTVEYREFTYAGGRIPGGFIKREGRPSEKEILTSRQIDRPIRPLFPEAFRNETQVVAFVGDGGALMMGNEIATAMQYGGNPIMVISDNGMYGTIGMHSYVRYPERAFMEGTRLTNPDFAAWGRSFGAEGITIREESEVADGIARAFAVKTKPVVVHCLTSAIQMSAWRRYTGTDALP